MAAEALLDGAAAGDLACIQELANRLDGRPVQQVIATDEEGRGLAVALIAYSQEVRPDDTLPVHAKALPAPDLEGTGQRD